MTTETIQERRDRRDATGGSSDRSPLSGEVGRVLRSTLAYARERDYTGWDYGDGMSSAVLGALPTENRVVNLVVQETIKRCPVNLRPVFRVEQRRNFKGAALFAMANLALDELAEGGPAGPPEAGGDDPTAPDRTDYRAEAHRLLEWLADQAPSGHAGFCLGHPHEIQDIQGLARVNEPDAVVTSYAVKALLRGADLDARYREIARSAEDFVVEELDYRPTEHGARITYSQNHGGEYYTLNAGALAGRLFVDLYAHTGEERLRERATAILDHIAATQEPNGGWYYRDPPSASHLSMDTHHNGFILESFQRFAGVTGADRYADVIDDALAFHREELFEPTGAPNFDETSSYPRDVHAAAQGILVFTYAGDLERARQVLAWTLGNLYGGDGRFFFRRHRLFVNRITLMRWCEAWMAYAIAEYLTAVNLENPIARRPG